MSTLQKTNLLIFNKISLCILKNVGKSSNCYFNRSKNILKSAWNLTWVTSKIFFPGTQYFFSYISLLNLLFLKVFFRNNIVCKFYLHIVFLKGNFNNIYPYYLRQFKLFEVLLELCTVHTYHSSSFKKFVST